MSDQEIIEASRRALLNHFTSQNIAHIGSFIVIVGGIVTLIYSRDSFLGKNIIWNIIFFCILDFLIALGIHTFGRTLYWGSLADRVIYAKPDSERMSSDKNFMLQLYDNTVNRVKDRRIRFFYKTRIIFIILVFMILLALELFLGLIIPFNVIVISS